ncbi:Deoxycytidine triphosphate deaminase [Thalassolituus maritimus]|uniref:Deoxycytidine triphosphate deaminase n=1 Tax=Thalassolituus maritimus TaxID=484498 RepID=A0A1N7JUP5_9GAMM|nr:hypothetical protein [Thalassolituus maritimus]SIS53082.1 Deoxycytidine triphosphate deaminase [Thalassolituus maritimus]
MSSGLKFFQEKVNNGQDPFPRIPPALLNSSDIQKYVHVTSMIAPFDSQHLKGASYEAKIGNEVIYWDIDTKKKIKISLESKGDYFTLPPNSIAYVQIQEEFDLPPYIALRFNLKIKHVYRGLLLGTGPLIDPGYKGKINIPLHNLTANSYQFEFNEGLIWIEFTKLSPHPKWDQSVENYNEPSEFPLKEIASDKTKKSMEYFLSRAHKGSIISSIPDTFRAAEEKANNAESTLKRLYRVAVVSVIGVGVAICSLIYQGYSLQHQIFDKLRNEIIALEKEVEQLRNTSSKTNE